MEFTYNSSHFIYTVRWGALELSHFDITLQESWKQKMNEGKFRYQLRQLQTRILDGKFGFVVQLNPERALLRRKPQALEQVNQPFNPAEFNFTKVSSEETILFLRSAAETNPVWAENDRNPIIINVSPLEFGNSLLVPQIGHEIPQKLTLTGLKLATDMVLLSGHPGFRVGFNSPGGFASVNHQHYHIYYLNYRLPIETAEIRHLKGPCYVFRDYPAQGFIFPLEEQRVDDLVIQAYKLVTFLKENQIPHNLFITRADTCKDPKPDVLETIRICIWARKPSFGAKDDWNFNPALCEFGGHLLIKDEDNFNNITEEQMASCLEEVTTDDFKRVASAINEIYT